MLNFRAWQTGLCSALASFAVAASSLAQKEVAALRDDYGALIAEADHLRVSLGDSLWPGWSTLSIPILFVDGDYEFAIGFPKTLPGTIAELDNNTLRRRVAVRRRTQSPTLAASFDVEGVPAVVLGTPEALEWKPTQWVVKAVHEMFHVLQAARGRSAKIRRLEIGPDDDAAWQLSFPFPYDDVQVNRLLHLQGYPLHLAGTFSKKDDIKYACGTALEGARVLQSFLGKLTGDERAYHYALFQEWTEGIAFYTEYRMAELAAGDAYEPTAVFLALPEMTPYREFWESYKSQRFLIKHAGRAARSRLVFYHLGLGKGLVLDRLLPDWKAAYFAPTVWMDDLLARAVGRHTMHAPLTVGEPAPDFDIDDIKGRRYTLKELHGQTVLIDFWQPWCPPCLAELPYIDELRRRHGKEGLTVLGIVDRVDAKNLDDLHRKTLKMNLGLPTLLDPDGVTAIAYGVNHYPHTVLVDATGVVRWAGTIAGAEGRAEFDQLLVRCLRIKENR